MTPTKAFRRRRAGRLCQPRAYIATRVPRTFRPNSLKSLQGVAMRSSGTRGAGDAGETTLPQAVASSSPPALDNELIQRWCALALASHPHPQREITVP